MLKKFFAPVLAGAFILGCPGPAPYQALAAATVHASKSAPKIAVIPAISHPAAGLAPLTRQAHALATGLTAPRPVATAQKHAVVRTREQPQSQPAVAAQSLLPAGLPAPTAAQQPARTNTGPETLLDASQSAQNQTAEVLSAQISREDARAVSGLLFEGRSRAAAAQTEQPSGAGLAAPRNGNGLSKPDQSQTAAGSGELAGKTLLYIVSRINGRNYLYENMLRLSRKYGFELAVLGYPDQKDFAVSMGIKPENYHGADIGNHSPENIAAIAAQVQELSKTRRMDAVKTYLNAYSQLEAELSQALGVAGNAPEAVRAAHTKSLARKLMNAYPDASLHLPAFAARSEAEAREAFLKILAAGFGKAVAKPDSGGGGWGVTLNIESPEAAAAAYRDIIAKMDGLIKADPRKARSKQVDQKPLVLFEGQIPDGLMLDAEVIMRRGEPVFMNLAYNPPALGNQERGTTYPAALPAELAALAKNQTRKALDAVGLKTGNAHVELILTLIQGKLAAPVVEINARMGGADIWASVRETAGVDAMEEGMLAAFGRESRPQPVEKPGLLQHRFLIARTAGRLKAVRGLPETGGEIFLSEAFLAPGDMVTENDLLGNITIRGAEEIASRDRLFELLRNVEIDIETADGKVATQTGIYGHDSEEGRLVAGDWADRIEFGRAGWLQRIRMLPKSFLWGFAPAWTLNAMAQEIQAVAMPLFSAALFGLPTALMITGLGYVTRVAGAWLGSAFMARFNPKWVNVAAVAALALAGTPIILASSAAPGLMLAAFLANAVVQGLVYGINRGVAENLLPRMIIGNHNPAKLELGLNYAYQWVEIACIVMAFFVAVPLLDLVGGLAMMAISSAGIAVSAAIYATLKYREPWHKPIAEPTAQAPAPMQPTAKLGFKDYLPYGFFRFMHFMVYGVLSTVLALSVFSSPSAAGTMIGLYDGGSWLASLLATLTLLPEKKLDRKAWAVMAAIAAAAFVWSACLGVPILTFVLGGILGGLVTINSNKWMAYYSQNLPQDKYRNLSKWMMTASVLATLPIFAAVSAARILPAVGAVLTMPAILLGINVAVTAVALLMALLLLRK
ncbi:MAG TPA: hypothetical protein DEB40_06040 [Elusimicrobia bacterium]|nr:hypothetical protein [Elusimicrobiota bacterium]HBT61287.1 hypothetical protein [Elusimicrobiota bacterium]